MARLAEFARAAVSRLSEEIFGNPVERAGRATLRRLERMEQEVAARLLEDVWTSTGVADDDEWKWSLLNQGGSSATAVGDVTPDQWDSLRKKARTLALTSPLGKGIVAAYQDYIVGEGLQVRPVIEDRKLRRDVSEWWASAEDELTLIERELEGVGRLIRDGELFLRYFDPAEGMEFAPFSVRWVEPGQVYDEDNNHSHGIETAPGDAERPLFFRLGKERVPAEEMLFVKVGTDANVKRGIPVLYSVMEQVNRYDRWLQDRIILNRLRAAIVLLRKHGGTGVSPTAIQALTARNRTSTRTYTESDGSKRTESMQRMRPGTILDVPATTTYEFLAPNVQASDVRYDGQAIIQSISAGTRLAPFMITGDVGEASFAAVMVTESPVVKHMVRMQAFIGRRFVRPNYVRALKAKIADGTFPKDTPLTCTIQGPRIVTRDRLKDVTADEKMHMSKALSLETWRQRDGLDNEVEQERVEREIQRMGEPQRPSSAFGGEAPEDEDNLGRVSPRRTDRDPEGEKPS